MADWSTPTLGTGYAAFLQALKDRDLDAGTLFQTLPTNPVDKMLRFDRATSTFREYNAAGGTWDTKVLAIAGGGTGATDAAGAKAALAIGTMANYNNNAVVITGGTLAGLTGLTVNCNIMPDSDGDHNLGSSAVRFNILYLRNGLVVPCGVDKYVTA